MSGWALIVTGGMLVCTSTSFGSTMDSHEVNNLVGTLCLGIIAAITALYFSLWLYRKREQTALLLAVSSSIAFFRILSTLPLIQESADPPILAIWRAIEYFSIIAGTIVFSWFLFGVFDTRPWLWLQRLHASVGSILCVIPLITPYDFYRAWLGVFQCYLVFCYLMFAVLILSSWRQGKAGARPILFGYAALILAVFADIFLGNRLQLIFVSFSPLGVAFFLLTQALWLMYTTAQAFSKSELLTEKMLEHEKTRTTFFHNTSHELRTPLNGIIGFLDLLVKEHYAPIPENARPPLLQALQLAEGLKGEVNTILELARMRSGRNKANARHFPISNLQHIANTLAAALLTRYPSSHFSVDYHSLDSSQTFFGDQEKIITILRNLLGNAFKFAREDSPNEVSLSLYFSNNELTIRVVDTGIGIPLEQQGRIFEEFFQVDADQRRNFEGTGLGLALVKNLCAMMGGTIEFTSQHHKGSSFTVRIPQQNHENEVAEEIAMDHLTPNELGGLSRVLQREDLPASEDAELGGRWKIFLVDDHIANLQLLTDILRADYDITTASSGRRALEKMQNWLPDLVLLDMMMPEVSGEDVLRHMKKDHRLQHVPIILITAQASEDDRLYALRLGADDYLAKPILIDELRLRVRNILNRHHDLKERERLEIQDKMAQLGALFSDLSHEMKNMLHGASTIKALETQDAQIALAPISLTTELKEQLAESLHLGTQNAHIGRRLQIMGPIIEDTYLGIRQQIQGMLAASGLSDSDLSSIWSEVQILNPDELVFFENQLRLLIGYQTLIGLTEHARHLAFSVLSYARSGQNSSGHCELQQIWSDFMTLIQPRSRQAGIRWDIDLTPQQLAIPAGALLQIFMNLCMNAIDAVQMLPEAERWIAVKSSISPEACVLRISNGGPPIPPQTRSQIFSRGFTTKGEAGSGLGLAVSRRLAQQVEGDLCYAAEEDHPCFVLRLPFARRDVA